MKTSHASRLGKLGLLGTSALWMAVAAAAPVHAQDDTATSGGGDTQAQAIVITGSRILRRDYSSDSPLVTVSTDDIENTSEIAVDQTLNKMPQFVAGQNQLTQATSTTASPTSSPGVATANLRGLGSNRTLVLLDGRRTQPADASLVVDLNTIPQSVVSGIEVITGGAGATYGADAVAGVVNFKLKKNFSGITLDAQTGITSRGDGFQTKVSGVIGGNFEDGRGNAFVALTYSKRNAVSNADRPFQAAAFTDPQIAGQFLYQPGWKVTPTSNNTRGALYPTFFDYGTQPQSISAIQSGFDSVFNSYGFPTGDVSLGSGSVIYWNTAPTLGGVSLFSDQPGAISGSTALNYKGDFVESKLLANGALSSVNRLSYISAPTERYSMFARAHYDITDHMTAYFQGNFNQSETDSQSSYAPAVNQWGVGIPYVKNNDPTNFVPGDCGASVGHQVPTDLCTILDGRTSPAAPWELNQAAKFVGPEHLRSLSFVYEVLAGLKGDFGIGDWTYDAYISHGRTNQQTNYIGFVALDQYQALIAQRNWGSQGSGTSVLSASGLGQSVRCTTGLNPFLDTPVSQDCLDAIAPPSKTATDLTQDQAVIDIQGGIMDLPYGELRGAFGASYRSNDFSYLPDSNLNAASPTHSLIGQFGTLPATGSTNVKELYGELLVPLLRDLPAVRSLDLDLGYRYSDYNTAGGVSTWKATADWSVVRWFSLRGGYQHANRAPNVAELFQPGTISVVPWADSDPCAINTRATWGNYFDVPKDGSGNPIASDLTGADPAHADQRAKVQALCTAIAGSTSVNWNTFKGKVGVYFPLSRDLVAGNVNTAPEVAKTWTLGAVLRNPDSLAGLGRMSLSIDWYNIQLEGAISSVGTALAYQLCFNAPQYGANPDYDPNNVYCQQIHRESATGFWEYVDAKYQNIGMIKTSGLDVSFDWRYPVPGLGGERGSLNLNVGYNYLKDFQVQLVAPNGPITDYRNSINGPYGAQFPWKLNASLAYDFGMGSIGLNWQHRPEVRNVNAVNNPDTNTVLATKAYDLFDLNARVAVNDTIEMRAGVNNLFDKQPPLVGVTPGVTSAAGTTDVGSYDVLGRRFYIGAKIKF